MAVKDRNWNLCFPSYFGRSDNYAQRVLRLISNDRSTHREIKRKKKPVMAHNGFCPSVFSWILNGGGGGN